MIDRTDPIDELHAAAAKLRDLATRTTTTLDRHEVQWTELTVSDTEARAKARPMVWSQYAASVHPGVGSALADWLDAEAAIWQAVETVTAEYGPKGLKVTTPLSTHDQALAVARQINGNAQ